MENTSTPLKQECSDNFNTKNILKEKPVTPRMNPESLCDSISESELNPERFKLVYNHNQRLDERSRLIVSNTNYSDGQYEKEYERNKNPSLTAHKFSASVNRQFEKGSTTLSVSKHEKFIEEALLNPQTDEETTVQQLPALNYQYGEVFWKSGQQSASVNVSGNLIRYYRKKVGMGLGQLQHRVSNITSH